MRRSLEATTCLSSPCFTVVGVARFFCSSKAPRWSRRRKTACFSMRSLSCWPHKGLHSKWLVASHASSSEEDRGSLNPLDLSFVADKWWTLVTGTALHYLMLWLSCMAFLGSMSSSTNCQRNLTDF